MKRTRFSWLALTGLLALTSACDEPAEVACKKASSCGLLDKDTPLEACISELKADLPEGRLNECADCVDDHTCSELDNDACEEQCDD